MKARLYYLRNRTGKAAVAVNVKTRKVEEAARRPGGALNRPRHASLTEFLLPRGGCRP